ncbi:MAG: histidinol-phosphate transaminase [Spirochaetales bacterium]|nr:histidinol-phosphate transaminase [Spirochaetales bacterium]
MNIEKLVNPGTQSIKRYEPGKSVFEAKREQKNIEFIKMASNENPLGMSPMALTAIKVHAGSASAYPEVSCAELRAALAERFELSPEMFIVGNGADGIIYALAMAFINQDDQAIIPFITFPYYEIAVKALRGKVVVSRMKGYEIDLTDILNKITSKTKIIWLSNPNNPTGSMIKQDEFERFFKQVPENVLVVHDEVYADFAPRNELPHTITMLKQGIPNLILLRSFSKIYGLAGMRLGYGVAQEALVNIMYKVRPPFDVSVLAQAAGCAALNDTEFYNKTLKLTNQGKDYLYTELERMGLEYVRSYTNFIVIDTNINCRDVQKKLLERGIIIRPADTYQLPTCIRVTVGTEEQNKKFISALKAVLKS